MKRTILLLVLFINLSFYFGQNSINLNQGTIEQKKYFQTLKYEKYNDKLIVNTSINGKYYRFLFDTGAAFSLSKKLFEEIKLTKKGSVSVLDASGRKEELIVTSLPKLQLGEITFLNTEGFVLPETASQMFDCFQIDGIIGSNMLRNSVVQFDDAQKLITITDNSKNLNLKKVPFQEIKLTQSQSNPRITLILQKGNEKLADNVLFDSGADKFYDMSYEAYKFFNSKKTVIEVINESKGTYVWGIHGFDDIKPQAIVNIPSILVNNYKFENVKVLTTSGNESRIGSQLLKFGKATIDYATKKFYFEPTSKIENFNEISKKPWGISPIISDNKLVVGIIWDKSLEEKINLGDEILKVDEINYENLNLCDLFKSNDKIETQKSVVKLKDIHTNQIKIVEVKRL